MMHATLKPHNIIGNDSIKNQIHFQVNRNTANHNDNVRNWPRYPLISNSFLYMHFCIDYPQKIVSE